MSRYTDLIQTYVQNLGIDAHNISDIVHGQADLDAIDLEGVEIVDSLNGVTVPQRECDYVLILNSGKILFVTNIEVSLPGIKFSRSSDKIWFSVPEVTEGSLAVSVIGNSYQKSILEEWYTSLFHNSGCLSERVEKVHLCLCAVRKLPNLFDETINSIKNPKTFKSVTDLDSWPDTEVGRLDIMMAEQFRESIDKYNEELANEMYKTKVGLPSSKDQKLGFLRIIGVFLDCKCSVPEISVDYKSLNLERIHSNISFSRYIHDPFSLTNLYPDL